MKLEVNRTVKLSQEEVTTILLKAILGVDYKKETCSATYWYHSSWGTVELSVREEQECLLETLFYTGRNKNSGTGNGFSKS